MKYLTDELRRGAKMLSIREQIQEDIRTFMSGCIADLNDTNKTDVLCQIVVDNFKKLEE